MLLVVNIGNSNIRFGVFQSKEILDSWTINTRPYRTEDEFFAKFNSMYEPFGYHKNDFEEIVMASVVPPLTHPIEQALTRIHGFSPTVIDRNSPSSVQHRSKQIGTDLYANAVAAQELYEGHKIVIDFGTALTFIGIGPNGESLGVSIGPGIQTALNSLVGATAQLPEIEMKAPEKVLGFNTEACMQSGMIYGYLSLIEGMIDRINQEIGAESVVIATGGLSGIYAPLTSKINHQDQMHTLKGIVEIYRFTQK
ncbi:MAG TPA: type III pantothenate kinase [Moheibacter sp.]|nr:type III pantothenate kinase [Moheibacter sp.]